MVNRELLDNPETTIETRLNIIFGSLTQSRIEKDVPLHDDIQHLNTCISDMDNILVRQKDYIRELIFSKHYTEAKMLLEAHKEMWTQWNYLYKYEELMNLIKEKTNDQKTSTDHS